jgi:hypothetical protein
VGAGYLDVFGNQTKVRVLREQKKPGLIAAEVSREVIAGTGCRNIYVEIVARAGIE